MMLRKSYLLLNENVTIGNQFSYFGCILCMFQRVFDFYNFSILYNYLFCYLEMAYYFNSNSFQNNFNHENNYYYLIPLYYNVNIDENQNIVLPQSLHSQQLNFERINQSQVQPNQIMLSQLELPKPQFPTFQSDQGDQVPKNFEKQILSARKNSQSNITNHFFSFIKSRKRSFSTVQGCISSLGGCNQEKKEKLINIFYNASYVLHARKGRKYVNKTKLISLFHPQGLLEQINEIKQKIKLVSEPLEQTLQKLCQIFRKCCLCFLKTYSIMCILTSKRISPISKQQHLKKRRKILQAILQKSQE